MYQRIVDATHTNAWITEQELVAQGLAVKNRSNTILQSENLGKYGISMRPIREAVEDALQKYSKNIQP
jgi:hypothetical protein